MAKQKKQHTKPKPSSQKEKFLSEGKTFAFNRENYKLMFIGLALLVLGFLLMIGGGADDPNSFSYELFNFRRLTLAPILIMTGYVMQIFAIMKRPNE